MQSDIRLIIFKKIFYSFDVQIVEKSQTNGYTYLKMLVILVIFMLTGNLNEKHFR